MNSSSPANIAAEGFEAPRVSLAELCEMGYLVDSSSGHLLWFESVARKPAPVAGPRCEDDVGRWPASSVSWPGPLGLLARSTIEIGDLHTASRHGLEPQDPRQTGVN